jgi:hypothetical protein
MGFFLISINRWLENLAARGSYATFGPNWLSVPGLKNRRAWYFLKTKIVKITGDFTV